MNQRSGNEAANQLGASLISQARLSYVNRQCGAHCLFHCRTTPAHWLHLSTGPEVRLVVIVHTPIFFGLPDRVNVPAGVPVVWIVDNAIASRAWRITRWKYIARDVANADLRDCISVPTCSKNSAN